MFSLHIDLKPHNPGVKLFGLKRINPTICQDFIFGGGGGSDSTTSTSTMRYAPYVETKHSQFLDTAQSYRNSIINDSPFDGYSEIEIDDAFFGSGYAISSFPSLYDMYGKFMAGLDIESLYSQVFETVTDSPVLNDLVAAESTLLDDDIEANVLPRFELGARDLNSAMSSSFIVGKALIEEARVKSISKFSAELKYNMIPISVDVWKSHLTWNATIIDKYMAVMKTYFAAKLDVDGYNYSLASKDKLWPFTVLDQERAALGALQGARTSTNTESQDSGGSWLTDMIGMASGVLGLFA